jgi:hypothetical protein
MYLELFYRQGLALSSLNIRIFLCHSDRRPVEDDSAKITYGKHRLVVRHIERKDEVVVSAGTRIDEVVCQSCWDNGKRFKDFRAV